MSEFTKRVLFAICAAPLFVLIIWVGGFLFIAVMLLVGLLIQRELIHLLDIQGFRPNATISYLSLVILMGGVVFQEYLAASFVGVALIQISVDTLEKNRRQMYRIMSTMFCTVYPALGVLSFVGIRELGSMPQDGYGLLLILLFMIWANDSMAYFVGKNFGRHLMAPHLSPKKTWEGFAGGFIGSGLGLLAATYFVPVEGYSFAETWPLIFVISIVGPIGDLTASKIKRAAGVKDTSTLIPGHGGVLDRFDSLLLSAPVMFLYLRYLVF
ncbi:MAG TPA: phosphatidate cytidylyltransferase [Bacteroidetes bacterium]|nr:phosphatidate cytidylyltransferase [Bacteroidota bacterium]